MAYKKNQAAVDKDQNDFQTSMDADTLTRHAEITSDPERHQAAVDHLDKKAKTAKTDHKMARAALEKKTKGRLKKTFGGGVGGKGGGFAEEKDKDQAADEAVVNTKE